LYGIGAAGASLTPLLTKFIGKRQLLMILMGATGVLSTAFYFIPKDRITWMFVLNGQRLSANRIDNFKSGQSYQVEVVVPPR
jgi:Na+/melibiose symporter-like transporter